MNHNLPTPTDDNQKTPPPKPIQGERQQDGDFNIQKKPQAKDTETGSTTEESLRNMDADSAHEIENGSKGNLDGNSQSAGDSDSDSMSEDQWKAKLANAKQHWTKLEQEELLDTQGDREQLSNLIQKRYSTSKADADRQVQEFLNKS